MVITNDAELLDAVRRGAPEAFDAFVERYGQRLLAFGLRMCGHHQDAEDVFQETLLKAYEGLRSVREPKAVRTWLFRVAANQCLMSRRKVPPGREVSLEDLKPPGWERGEPEDIPDWSQLPTVAAERAELRRLLESALAELPPEARIVALLRDVEGLSTQETAEALGLGVSAVKMRLHRARRQLRQYLACVDQARGRLAPR